MAVNIHLVTVVGGYVKALPAMLEHYRSLGVESCFVNMHLAHAADPVQEEIERHRFGDRRQLDARTAGPVRAPARTLSRRLVRAGRPG